MPNPLLVALALGLLGQAPPPDSPARTPEDVVSALETVLANAIAKAEPSVVAIHRDKSENEETVAIRGRNGPPQRRGLRLNDFDLMGTDLVSFDYASGVIIGDAGEIVTTFHSVRGASRLLVRAMNVPEFEAEIIAADSRSDMAVIAPRQIEGVRPPALKPIVIGDATKLRKGNFLVALGNPFNAARNDGRPSASWGILANVARRLDQPQDEVDRVEREMRHLPTLLQLDAKLNLGMSGGAVINMKGELVGLTTAAGNAAGFDAMAGYAIPMDTLGRNVVKTLKEGKEYEYGFLGIGLDRINSTNRVDSAKEGSPAAAGGVHVDDLIVAVGDMKVTDAESLLVATNSMPAGEPVVLKIQRRGALMEKTVELAKRKVSGPVVATNRPEPWRGIRVDYTSTLANTTYGPSLAEALARTGVVITEIESGSDADQAGLKALQVISRVGGVPVPNPRAFRKAVAGLKGPVELETDRGPVTIK